MKIISKFKDYYDHLVNKFGYDETRILDRRTPKEWNNYNRNPAEYLNTFYFAICGKIQVVIKHKGFFYFSPSEELDKYDNADFNNNNSDTIANQYYNFPVILLGDHWNWKGEKSIGKESFKPMCIPILKDFGFASIIPAEEMYQKIYDYLGWLKDNPPIKSNMSDNEKIISHGFDKKTSFRPNLK